VYPGAPCWHTFRLNGESIILAVSSRVVGAAMRRTMAATGLTRAKNYRHAFAMPAACSIDGGSTSLTRSLDGLIPCNGTMTTARYQYQACNHVVFDLIEA
jgi:hypothetical protein